jgi:hypothetical protein
MLGCIRIKYETNHHLSIKRNQYSKIFLYHILFTANQQFFLLTKKLLNEFIGAKQAGFNAGGGNTLLQLIPGHRNCSGCGISNCQQKASKCQWFFWVIHGVLLAFLFSYVAIMNQ